MHAPLQSFAWLPGQHPCLCQASGCQLHPEPPPAPLPLLSVPLQLCLALYSLPGLPVSHSCWQLLLRLKMSQLPSLVPSSILHHLYSNIYQDTWHLSPPISITTPRLAAPQRQELFLHFLSPVPSGVSKTGEGLVQVHKITKTESRSGFPAKN